MNKKFDRSRRILFSGIILIALGVTLTGALKASSNSMGTVLIAIGGLLFIAGMSARKKEQKK